MKLNFKRLREPVYFDKLLIRLLTLCCVFLLSLFIVPKIYHALALSTGFTATNVTLDPTTGNLNFDYSGGTFDGGSVVGIVDATTGAFYWNSISPGGSTFNNNCLTASCSSLLFTEDNASDNGITSVRIEVYDSSGNTEYSQPLNYPLPYSTTDTSQNAYTSVATGWVPAGETWTYASASSPSFTVTLSGDFTGLYAPGMRVMLTQSSNTEYFLVTGVSYSSPNTTITLYGGTNYTLSNSTISNIFFSAAKAPFEFPLNPADWTVTATNSTGSNQASPTANTWYNLAGLDITVPPGTWQLEYNTFFGVISSTAGSYDAYVTLSTSNNSQSNADMTTLTLGNSVLDVFGNGDRQEYVSVTSPTTYYLNEMTKSSGITSLHGNGNANSPSYITAVSSYL